MYVHHYYSLSVYFTGDGNTQCGNIPTLTSPDGYMRVYRSQINEDRNPTNISILNHQTSSMDPMSKPLHIRTEQTCLNLLYGMEWIFSIVMQIWVICCRANSELSKVIAFTRLSFSLYIRGCLHRLKLGPEIPVFRKANGISEYAYPNKEGKLCRWSPCHY